MLPAPLPLVPLARRETLRLGPLELPTTAPRRAMLEIPIDAAGDYADPFDPTQVRLEAKVTEAGGRTYTVPGFVDRPFRRTLVNGAERLEPEGPTRWRLRIAPETEGDVRLRVTFADATGERTQNGTFRCVASKEPGFVRVSPDDRRYFAFSGGGSFWPLGANLPSAGPRGTYEVDERIEGLGAHGANAVRLLLSPSWTALAQEVPGRREEGKGVGEIDLANAWRLDHLLATAREKGVYATLCLDDSAVLRSEGPGAWWAKTPHNSDNGGPLRIWRDFWTNETMDRLYRNRLRYLVARYGADAHVLGWEFWNEVDRVDEFDPAVVRDWHQRMARTLDGLDAYRHLRSTSLAATVGLRTIDLIPELDLVASHGTDLQDPASTVAGQQSRKSGWGKPHLFDLIAEPPGEDADGVGIHDPIWASIATGASGGALPRLGDSNVSDPYALFDGPSRFLAGVDWTAEGFRQTEIALSLANPHVPPPPGDLTLEGGMTNGPLATVVADGKLLGPMPAGILHGVGVHPELHNPLVLRIRVDRPTRFEVGVTTVSGRGGANLRVELDGAPALSQDFPDPDGDKSADDLRQYAGTYAVPLAKGVHTLRVENTGADWVRVVYRIDGVVTRKTPNLSAWAVVGDGTAMAWLRAAGRTYRAVAELKRTPPPAPPTVMRLRGLRSGTWRAEVWDTWAGKPLAISRTKVGIGGGVRVLLPTIERDVAVKLVREGK